MDGNNAVLTFTTFTYVTYDIQRTTDLASAPWSTIASNLYGCCSMTYTDVGAAVGPQRYYRLHQQ